MMRAQKATAGTAQGRRSDLGFSATQVEGDKPTHAEAGIDKNLAHRARMLGGYLTRSLKEAVKENRACRRRKRRLGCRRVVR